MRRTAVVLLVAFTLVLALAGRAFAQKRRGGQDARPLTELGVVSQSAQPIGDPGLGPFAERYDEKGWLHLETTHFRIASSLGKIKLSAKEKKRLAAELEELLPYFPELGPKPKSLPPEVYLVLIGVRLEKLYAEFQRIAQVEDKDFPASRAAQNGRGKYMGDGPYLGEREKYEVVLHRRRIDHTDFVTWQRGIKANDTVRWHNRKPSKLVVSMPCVDSDLTQDRWLWPHLAHNVAHMMFDGYKFFAYDPPLWMSEGLALYLEKRIEPMSFTRDGGEGVFFEPDRSSDWSKDALKLVKREKHASVPSLLAARGPDDLDKAANITAWSITTFLIEEHPDEYAKLIGAVKGQLDERGYPSGADMKGVQRRELMKHLDWSPLQLEAAWLEWVTGEDEDD